MDEYGEISYSSPRGIGHNFKIRISIDVSETQFGRVHIKSGLPKNMEYQGHLIEEAFNFPDDKKWKSYDFETEFIGVPGGEILIIIDDDEVPLARQYSKFLITEDGVEEVPHGMSVPHPHQIVTFFPIEVID